LQSLAKRRIPSAFDQLIDEVESCMDALVVSLERRKKGGQKAWEGWKEGWREGWREGMGMVEGRVQEVRERWREGIHAAVATVEGMREGVRDRQQSWEGWREGVNSKACAWAGRYIDLAQAGGEDEVEEGEDGMEGGMQEGEHGKGGKVRVLSSLLVGKRRRSLGAASSNEMKRAKAAKNEFRKKEGGGEGALRLMRGDPLVIDSWNERALRHVLHLGEEMEVGNEGGTERGREGGKI